MKPKTTNPVSLRCIHRTPAGRQCRRFAADAHSALCPQHRAEQNQVQAADHYLHLTRRFHDFQTAQGINHSLHNLYELLAQNRISTRRAAVLSYISSLLLRTLPQIDADNAAGIKFPPKMLPVANAEPAPDQNAGSDEDTDSAEAADVDEADDLDSDSDSDSDSVPNLVNTWDPSIPEPDPKKKPS